LAVLFLHAPKRRRWGTIASMLDGLPDMLDARPLGVDPVVARHTNVLLHDTQNDIQTREYVSDAASCCGGA